jgi:hypothetical protein
MSEILLKIYIDLYVTYLSFLSDSNKTWIWLTDFRKNTRGDFEGFMNKMAIFVVRHSVISAFNWQFWRKPRNSSVRQLITRLIFWLGKLDTFINPARFMLSALKLLSWNQGYEIRSCEWTSSLFKLLLHWPKSVVESSWDCLVKLQLFWKELLYERQALHESTWDASNKGGSLYL